MAETRSSIQALDKMQRQDHDLLIRLEGKIDSITSDLKAMKDGMSTQLIDHEGRISTIEGIVQRVSPDKTFGEFQILKQEVHDFKTSINVARIIAGAIGGVIMFVLSQVPGILRSWGIIK